MNSNFGLEFLIKTGAFDNKTALIYREESISFEEFGNYVRNWNIYLQSLKDTHLFSELRIATLCTNSPQFLAFVISSQILGIVIIPLNPSYKKYEIDQYIQKCEANFVIRSEDVSAEKLTKIENHSIERITANFESDHLHEMLIHTFENGEILFFSSGTTGPPKEFKYNQTILCAQLEQLREIEKDSSFFSPSTLDICYGVLPYFHAGGLITVLSMLWCGCTVVVNDRWNEHEFLSNIQNVRVSVLFIVPPVLNFLANHPIVSNYDLSSLKTIYIGAAASSPSNFEKISKRFTHLENLIQLYGTTECGVLLCSTGKGKTDGKVIGKPFPLVEIQINGDNSEILVKSATATIPNDFMETGDLGHWNNQNNLVIVGRSKEMLKVRGWQVNPNEIEDVIRNVENVIDCAVYEDKNKFDDSTRLVAKVIGPSELRQPILNLVKECLASYKQLDDVIFVDELPRNPSGKLVRRFL